MSVTCRTHQVCTGQAPRLARPSPVPAGWGSAHQARARCTSTSQRDIRRIGQQQHRRRLCLTAATPDEEAEIERMKRDASQGSSLLESEIVGVLVKVAAVSVVVGAAVIILDLAKPVIDTTIARFPVQSLEAPAQQEEQ